MALVAVTLVVVGGAAVGCSPETTLPVGFLPGVGVAAGLLPSACLEIGAGD